VCRRVCGKYVQVPVADAQAMTGVLSMTGLIDRLFGSLPSLAKTSGGYFGPAIYQGQSALQFRDRGYSMEVARTGTPYPLAITAPNGQYLDFSDWNAVTLPSPPPASELVRLSQLG
jgi:hypothetical protein